jgi:hypothetical protein
MAEVLTEFGTERGSYPWDTWTNGKPWLVRQGVDFPCAIVGFTSSLRSYARRNRFKVRVRVNAEAKQVKFEFTKLEAPKRSRKPARKAGSK